MSLKVRNPFLLRAAERIESDSSFLRLYSPIVLDSFLDMHALGKLWKKIIFVRSSPGAGKTSLLRLFEPSSLLALLNRKSNEEFKELYKKLRKLEVVSDDNINILGVNITFTRNYELLENFKGIEAGNRQRLFFSLLNSRIITATLRSVIALKKLRFPEDLDKIDFIYQDKEFYFKKIDVPCNGQQLYNWASSIESSIYDLLDSFLEKSNYSIEGHSELFSIVALAPQNILFEGKAVCKQILYLLDDVHKLSTKQRSLLIEFLLEKRANVSVWISERLEALNNLKTNSGRDYEELNLENYWKEREGRFEKLLSNIANKRAAESREGVEFTLESEQDESDLVDVYKKAKAELFASIKNLTSSSNKFNLWVDNLISMDETDQEICLQAKKIEILIHRNMSKGELALDYTLSLEELEQKADEKVVTAAKLFLCHQYNLPYYFGMTSLSKISTNNIEQFLSFSAPLYERMLSMNLNLKNVTISAKEQDKEIKKIANEKWKELQRIIPDSGLVMRFLENLCAFCLSETYKPSASYAPGVNGFYIDSAKTIILFNDEEWLMNEFFEDLRAVLNNCLAFNVLHVKETTQGKKGEKKNVYYLNRWLCVKFDLPLSYGGWRTKKPDELLRWTRR